MIFLFPEASLKNMLFRDENTVAGYLDGSVKVKDVFKNEVPQEQQKRVKQASFRLLKQMHDGLKIAPMQKPVQRLVWTYQKMKTLSKSHPEVPVDWNKPWAPIYAKLSLESFRQKLCNEMDIWFDGDSKLEKGEEAKQRIGELFDRYEESEGSLCQQVVRTIEASLPILSPDQNQEVSISQIVYSFAVSSHYAKGIGEFIAQGGDVNERDSLNRTLLHWAAEAGDWEIIAALLEAKADLHLQDEQGDTPLFLALKHGHVDIADQLIKKGASCDVQNRRGYSPLHLAAERGDMKMAALLMSHQTDLNSQTHQKKLTPLHITAAKGCVEMVDLLIQAGADVNLQTTDGNTPLHLASYQGKLDVIRLLLAAPDIDTTLIGAKGQTPLNLSLLSGSPAVAWELFTLENTATEFVKPFSFLYE